MNTLEIALESEAFHSRLCDLLASMEEDKCHIENRAEPRRYVVRSKHGRVHVSLPLALMYVAGLCDINEPAPTLTTCKTPGCSNPYHQIDSKWQKHRPNGAKIIVEQVVPGATKRKYKNKIKSRMDALEARITALEKTTVEK